MKYVIALVLAFTVLTIASAYAADSPDPKLVPKIENGTIIFPSGFKTEIPVVNLEELKPIPAEAPAEVRTINRKVWANFWKAGGSQIDIPVYMTLQEYNVQTQEISFVFSSVGDPAAKIPPLKFVDRGKYDIKRKKAALMPFPRAGKEDPTHTISLSSLEKSGIYVSTKFFVAGMELLLDANLMPVLQLPENR